MDVKPKICFSGFGMVTFASLLRLKDECHDLLYEKSNIFFQSPSEVCTFVPALISEGFQKNATQDICSNLLDLVLDAAFGVLRSSVPKSSLSTTLTRAMTGPMLQPRLGYTTVPEREG